MTPHPMPTFRQHALALGLAALVTAGVLSGLAGLADTDRAAALAQQMSLQPQAQAALPAPSA